MKTTPVDYSRIENALKVIEYGIEQNNKYELDGLEVEDILYQARAALLGIDEEALYNSEITCSDIDMESE